MISSSLSIFEQSHLESIQNGLAQLKETPSFNVFIDCFGDSADAEATWKDMVEYELDWTNNNIYAPLIYYIINSTSVKSASFSDFPDLLYGYYCSEILEGEFKELAVAFEANFSSNQKKSYLKLINLIGANPRESQVTMPFGTTLNYSVDEYLMHPPEASEVLGLVPSLATILENLENLPVLGNHKRELVNLYSLLESANSCTKTPYLYMIASGT